MLQKKNCQSICEHCWTTSKGVSLLLQMSVYFTQLLHLKNYRMAQWIRKTNIVIKSYVDVGVRKKKVLKMQKCVKHSSKADLFAKTNAINWVPSTVAKSPAQKNTKQKKLGDLPENELNTQTIF